MLNMEELRNHFHLKRFMDKERLEDVAKKIGVSSATLSRFEQGKVTITIDVLQAITNYLDLDIVLVDKGKTI